MHGHSLAPLTWHSIYIRTMQGLGFRVDTSGVQDAVHRLAWSLDACLKDRVLDEKRMRELHQFFVPLNRPCCEPFLAWAQPGFRRCSPNPGRANHCEQTCRYRAMYDSRKIFQIVFTLGAGQKQP